MIWSEFGPYSKEKRSKFLVCVRTQRELSWRLPGTERRGDTVSTATAGSSRGSQWLICIWKGSRTRPASLTAKRRAAWRRCVVHKGMLPRPERAPQDEARLAQRFEKKKGRRNRGALFRSNRGARVEKAADAASAGAPRAGRRRRIGASSLGDAVTSIRAVSHAAVAPAFVPPPLVRATPSKQMVFDRKAARIKALSEAHAAALESVEEQTGNLESVVPEMRDLSPIGTGAGVEMVRNALGNLQFIPRAQLGIEEPLWYSHGGATWSSVREIAIFGNFY